MESNFRHWPIRLIFLFACCVHGNICFCHNGNDIRIQRFVIKKSWQCLTQVKGETGRIADNCLEPWREPSCRGEEIADAQKSAYTETSPPSYSLPPYRLQHRGLAKVLTNRFPHVTFTEVEIKGGGSERESENSKQHL